MLVLQEAHQHLLLAVSKKLCHHPLLPQATMHLSSPPPPQLLPTTATAKQAPARQLPLLAMELPPPAPPPVTTATVPLSGSMLVVLPVRVSQLPNLLLPVQTPAAMLGLQALACLQGSLLAMQTPVVTLEVQALAFPPGSQLAMAKLGQLLLQQLRLSLQKRMKTLSTENCGRRCRVSGCCWSAWLIDCATTSAATLCNKSTTGESRHGSYLCNSKYLLCCLLLSTILQCKADMLKELC